MTSIMAKTIKKHKLKDAYNKSKSHKSRSCTCTNLMKVSTSNGIMFVVADKNIKQLKQLIKKCKSKKKSFIPPKIKKLNKKDIYDPYDDSCENWKEQGVKCDKKKQKKEREAYEKSFKEILKTLKKTFKKNKI